MPQLLPEERNQLHLALTVALPTNDNLVSLESVLFQGIDPVRLGKPRPRATPYGLPKERFEKYKTKPGAFAAE